MGRRATIGIALGGGAARGWAHIGVLGAGAPDPGEPVAIGAQVDGAGDPPEIEIVPDAQDIGLMDFHRAALAVERGVRSVEVRAGEIAQLGAEAG